MADFLNDLEKIANQVFNEHEMNPDVKPEMTQEEVDEAQTGQAPAPEGLSPEEAALKQQMDEEILMAEQEEQEEREEQHQMVDRALLEGAAEQAVAEMADEEIKDMLIEKAASELLGLGAFAKLIEVSTEDYDDHVKEAATQTLDYMSQSEANFIDGLNKTASDLFDSDENTDELFSREGVDFVFEQLAKLSDYNSLSKVASDEDVDSLAIIVENEADKINTAQEIVTDAYEEAIKEIAKEDIKEVIKATGEYDEGVEEAITDTATDIAAEELAREDLEEGSLDSLIAKEAKRFNPKSVAKGVGLFGAGAGVGAGAALLYERLKNGEITPDQLSDEELAAVEEIAVAEQQEFEQTASFHNNSLEGLIYKEAKRFNPKSVAKGVGLFGAGAGAGAGAVLLYERLKNGEVTPDQLSDEELAAVEEIAIAEQQEFEQTASFFEELGMYKQAKIGKTLGKARGYDNQKKQYKRLNKESKGLKNNQNTSQANAHVKAIKDSSDERIIQTASFFEELGMYKQAKIGKTLGKAREYGKQKKQHKKLNKELKGLRNSKDTSQANSRAKEIAQERSSLRQAMKNNTAGKNAYNKVQNVAKGTAIGAAGVGAGAIGAAAHARNKEHPHNREDQLMENTAGYYRIGGFTKEASIVQKTKQIFDRSINAAKNLKENKALLRKKELEMNDLVLEGLTHGPLEPGRVEAAANELTRVGDDVLLGSTIRYGIPAAGLGAGAIIAGKKLADKNRKKEELAAGEEEVFHQVPNSNPLDKQAAVGALMPAWRNVKELGKDGFKKVTDNFSSLDKAGDIGMSVENINADYTTRNVDPRLSKYFQQQQQLQQ